MDGEKLWNEHALAMGKIAIAWNAFQEVLAEMYGNLFERADWDLAMVSWHALVSDVSQQDMLRAASKKKYGDDSKAYKEINWMLEQTKQALSHQRNFGVHTPFFVLNKLDNTTDVVPNYLMGNRKAAAFHASGKDALKEFAEYESQIRKLTSFAFGLLFTLSPVRIGPESWPERPQLQSRAPSLSPKA